MASTSRHLNERDDTGDQAVDEPEIILYDEDDVNDGRWERGRHVKEMDFSRVPICIKFWYLPPDCRTQQLGRKIGAIMGEVIDTGVYDDREKAMRRISARQVRRKKLMRRTWSLDLGCGCPLWGGR
ncbi:hypothetical protein SESBI_05081 [Sesbania bispinosa]|nr:hypothetical protein SESBI_05081 [Sesbania bispinosa]